MFLVIDLARSSLSCSQLSVFLDRRHGIRASVAVGSELQRPQAAHLLPSILKIGVTLKEEEQRT